MEKQFSEFSEVEKEKKIKPELEFSRKSEDGLNDLSKWLSNVINNKEAVEQLVFVLLSLREESFVNQCDEAVKKFGIALAEHWGGEESFFDLLSQEVAFMEIRSTDPLSNKFKRDNYHSIALLEFPSVSGRKFCLAFDLVYGHIAGEGRRESALSLYCNGNAKKALEKIKEYYGGRWKIINTLDKERKTFLFNEQF